MRIKAHYGRPFVLLSASSCSSVTEPFWTNYRGWLPMSLAPLSFSLSQNTHSMPGYKYHCYRSREVHLFIFLPTNLIYIDDSGVSFVLIGNITDKNIANCLLQEFYRLRKEKYFYCAFLHITSKQSVVGRLISSSVCPNQICSFFSTIDRSGPN